MKMPADLKELHDEIAYWELVKELLAEQDDLEKQIIALRRHVNRLHVQLCYAREGHMQTVIPYPDPASDIVRDFSGFAAMQRYDVLNK